MSLLTFLSLSFFISHHFPKLFFLFISGIQTSNDLTNIFYVEFHSFGIIKISLKTSNRPMFPKQPSQSKKLIGIECHCSLTTNSIAPSSIKQNARSLMNSNSSSEFQNRSKQQKIDAPKKISLKQLNQAHISLTNHRKKTNADNKKYHRNTCNTEMQTIP